MPTGFTESLVAWQPKTLSNENISCPTTSNNSLSSKLKWYNSEIRLEFKSSCLKQDKVTFTPNNVVNLFIVHELNRWSQDLNGEFTLKGCLFGAVTLTKKADRDKYAYSRFGFGFDSRSLFLVQILIRVEMLLFLK